MDEVTNLVFSETASRPSFWAGICSCGVYSTSPFSIIHAGRGPMTLGPLSQNNSPPMPAACKMGQLFDQPPRLALMKALLEEAGEIISAMEI
ncbi:unnamed protein product [Clonostachys byssicola]|uniref:Uncharacterized protein n=1 Tax=Clonostachys byssicola TaxID=160290 RepID=A0A9N9Y1L4_9HYPO|nr:unnamed protein product [Clonostachys byssicola]